MAPSKHDLESRIAKLEAENLQLRGEVANLNARIGRLENAIYNGKQKGKSAGKVKSAEDLQQRISSVASEIQELNSAMQLIKIQDGVDGAPSKLLSKQTPVPEMQFNQKLNNNVFVFGKEFNNVEFASNLESQMKALSSWPASFMMDGGPLPATYNPSKAERMPKNQLNGAEAPKAAYVPPGRRPVQQQTKQPATVPAKHRAEALKSMSNESFPELNPRLTRKDVKKIGEAVKLKKQEKVEQQKTAKKSKPADGSCQKMCEANEHSCGKFHEADKPCPPCRQTLQGFKLKCSHKYDIPCHRRNKIADVCSECDSKAKSTVANEAPPVPHKQNSIGVNHIPCPDEMVLSKFREYLGKFAGTSNLEEIATELGALIQRDAKYAPIMAQSVIETAVSDTEQQPRHYALLISKMTRILSSETTAFHDQLTSFIQLCVLAFTSNEASQKIKAMLQRKPLSGMDPKSRNNSILKLMGALYWEDVVTTEAIVTYVLAPLLDAPPADETLDYFCKLLLMIGSKLEKGVSELASSENSSSVDIWYENAFVQLENLSSGVDISAVTKNAIQHILSLKNVDWDKYRLSAEPAPDPTPATVFAVPSARPVSNPTAPTGNPKKQKQKKSKLSEENVLAFSKVETSSSSKSAHVTSSSTNVTEDNEWLDIDLDDDIMDPLAAAYVPFKYSDSDSETAPSRAHSVTKVRSKASSRASSVTSVRVTSASSLLLTASASRPSQLKPIESRAFAEMKALAKSRLNAAAFFSVYARYDNSLKKSIRKELLQNFFKQGVNYSDFVRDLSKLIRPKSNNSELAAMGHLIELMKEMNLIHQHDVLIGFIQGAVSMISSYTADQLIQIIGNVAYALVSIFNDHHVDFAWIADLFTMTGMHDLGRPLVMEILHQIHARVGVKKFVALWCATRPQLRKPLEVLNVQPLLRTEPTHHASPHRKTSAARFNGGTR